MLAGALLAQLPERPVALAAILLGRWLIKRMKLSVVRYVGAAVCGVLAILTVIEALTR